MLDLMAPNRGHQAGAGWLHFVPLGGNRQLDLAAIPRDTVWRDAVYKNTKLPAKDAELLRKHKQPAKGKLLWVPSDQ